jgi:hypothetical protein
MQVPGTAALGKGASAGIISVSCAAAGSCAAGGYYTDRSGHKQAFAVAERAGRWGTATEIPGTAALNKGRRAATLSVSCAAPGSCAAAGIYTDHSRNSQAFVVTEQSGRWGTAMQVPGIAALGKGASAGIISVSCAAPGQCAAGGFYIKFYGFLNIDARAFLVTEHSGKWATAIEVPGIAALNKSGQAETFSVSCAARGNCAAGGGYPGSDRGNAFVVSTS